MHHDDDQSQSRPHALGTMSQTAMCQQRRRISTFPFPPHLRNAQPLSGGVRADQPNEPSADLGREVEGLWCSQWRSRRAYTIESNRVIIIIIIRGRLHLEGFLRQARIGAVTEICQKRQPTAYVQQQKDILVGRQNKGITHKHLTRRNLVYTALELYCIRSKRMTRERLVTFKAHRLCASVCWITLRDIGYIASCEALDPKGEEDVTSHGAR